MFPAAATTTDPRSIASSIAVCSEGVHGASTEKDRFITFAGVWFAGTFSTVPPLAQVIDAITSLNNPPRQENALIG